MTGIRAVARLIAALAIAGGVAALPNRAVAARSPAPPTCTPLPAELLGRRYQIRKRADRAGQYDAGAAGGQLHRRDPERGATVPVAYCLVVLSYSSEKTAIQAQNITIYVGLPLNSTDGGVTGSTVDPPWNFTTVEGNWNGRTEGIGGGVCTGNTNVNPVPSSTALSDRAPMAAMAVITPILRSWKSPTPTLPSTILTTHANPVSSLSMARPN